LVDFRIDINCDISKNANEIVPEKIWTYISSGGFQQR